jgi:hypothetical protein
LENITKLPEIVPLDDEELVLGADNFVPDGEFVLSKADLKD